MSALSSELNILRPYVNDMVALERDILNGLEKQKGDDRVKADLSTAALLQRIYGITRGHLLTLEEHSAAVGGESGTAIKEAVASVAGTVAGVYDLLRKHPVSRMLRDDYTALSLASVGYSMLYTSALALRDPALANVALRHLREKAPLVIELSDVIPRVVVQEIEAGNPSADASVIETVRSNIRQAWASPASA